MNMNKKFLKHYMETEPEGTAQKYIFLVDNQEIALNIIISGYQSLYLVQEEEDGYYSIDGFVDEMRSMQFQGSCQSSYHYVAACTVKWMNDRIGQEDFSVEDITTVILLLYTVKRFLTSIRSFPNASENIRQ